MSLVSFPSRMARSPRPRAPWAFALLTAVAACGKPAPTSQPSKVAMAVDAPSGVVLGKPAYDLAALPASARIAARRTATSRARLFDPPVSTSTVVADILTSVNARLSGCRITHTGTGLVAANGAFAYVLQAYYPNGAWSQGWQFQTSFAAAPDAAASQILALVPYQIFTGCERRGAPGDGQVLASEGQAHVDQLLPALNARLEGCSLRTAGTVADPDSDGNFRFFLEAVYPGGQVDPKVHFETNAKNVITADVADFLGMIPSQAFHQCKHKDGQPDPGPGIEALKRHLVAVVAGANAQLDQCVLAQDGDLGAIDATGAADYYLNATYADGSRDMRQRFRASAATAVDSAVAELLESIPTTMFRKCHRRGGDPGPGPGPDPRIEQMRTLVQRVLNTANDGLEQCTLIVDSDLGVIGADGVADVFLNANYADGTQDGRKKFRTSLSVDAAAQTKDLLELIPSQMFRKCRVKGGGDPQPDPRPDQAQAQVHVADVLGKVNDALDGCIVALSGRIGAVDDHGAFPYYLVAYVRATGTFADAVRFESNVHTGTDAEANVLLQLIPAVEFKQCKHRG